MHYNGVVITLALLTFAPSLADRVLVIANENSPVSMEIAQTYMTARKVKKLIKVKCQDSALDAGKETLPYADYKTQIEAPLLAYLKDHIEIDFVVLTKGVPIRLTGAPSGLNNDRPSLDSFMASTGYDKRKDAVPYIVNETGWKGKGWVNRFWNPTERFNRTKFGGLLVTRLDGYTLEDCKKLIENSVASDKDFPVGNIFLDAKGKNLGDLKKVPLPAPAGDMGYNDYDADLKVASELLKNRKTPVMIDETDVFVGGHTGLMGYASWGSNDPKYNADNYHSLRFAPGAVAETAVSTSGRTFHPATGGQSLIADLIRQGVTGAKGYCDEPFLNAIASPTVLFDRYTRGWTLAESFYSATRIVGWEDIVIGDPICMPYRVRTN